MRPLLPPLALAVPALALLPQEPTGAERYPRERQERVLRYFNMKGRLDVDKLRVAVSEAGFDLVFGPVEAASRPSNHVVAVSAPWETSASAVQRVLRKGKVQVEELEAFLFHGRVENGFPTFGVGLERIDYVLGMSGQIRWCDMVEGWTQFYCVEGKLEAEELEERWRKLQDPLGDDPATLGEPVQDELTWTLARELDEKEGRKLAKAIHKLHGVSSAEVRGSALTVRVTLVEVAAGSPGQAFPGPAGEPASPRVAYSTRELWDLLEEQGLNAPGDEAR